MGDERGDISHLDLVVRAAVLVLAMVVLLLAGMGAGEISRSTLQASDLDAVRSLADQRTVLLTVIAHVLSAAGSALLIGPVTVALCAAFYRNGLRWAAAGMALTTGGGALIFNLDKLMVGRPRPPVEHVVAAAHSSFPSGHATVSAAFYLALLILFLARRPSRARATAAAVATSALVIGIALSRIYLGVHYPTDVIGGMLLGATWTLLVGLALRHSHRPWATGEERTDVVNPASVRRTGETAPSAPPASCHSGRRALGAAIGHGRPSEALETREFA